MPRACSTELRERVLVAYEAGEGSQAAVARRFRVGGRALSRWLRAALAELVTDRNGATLAEYADRLAEGTGVRRSVAALCRALKSLGLTRKKRRSGRPSRIARTSPRHGPDGAPSWPGSTRAGWSSSTRAGSTPA